MGTPMKKIYRGYDIELTEGQWNVIKDGEILARLNSEDDAMNFVDSHRRAQRGQR